MWQRAGEGGEGGGGGGEGEERRGGGRGWGSGVRQGVWCCTHRGLRSGERRPPTVLRHAFPALVPPRRGAYDHVARRAAETGHRLVCVRAGRVWAKCPAVRAAPHRDALGRRRSSRPSPASAAALRARRLVDSPQVSVLRQGERTLPTCRSTPSFIVPSAKGRCRPRSYNVPCVRPPSARSL